MSGGQIGTAVGFVAGFFLPGGPQLWAGIGGAIGGAVDPTVIDGPGIGEVPQQTSQEGIPRPLIFARSQPIMGSIILTAPINVVTTFEEQGKSGPKVKTKTAYRHYCVGVCPGEADLLKAWRKGKLVYDATDPGMASNNAEFQKYARWHRGTYDQEPDPDQEEKHGPGVVHGFRGTAYLSLFEENVQDNGGAMSQWTFVVSTTATVNTPTESEHKQTYQNVDFSAPGPYLTADSDGIPFGLTATQANDIQWDVEAGQYFVLTRFDDQLDPQETENVNLQESGIGQDLVQVVGVNPQGWAIAREINFGQCKLLLNGYTAAQLKPNDLFPDGWWYGEGLFSPEYGGRVWFHENSVIIGVGKTNSTDLNSLYKWPLVSAGGDYVYSSAHLYDISADTGGPRFWMHVSRSGSVRYINTAKDYKRLDNDLVFQADEDLPEAISAILDASSPPAFEGFGVDETLDLAAYVFNGDQISIYRRSTGDLLGTFDLEGAGGEGHHNVCTRIVFTPAAIYVQRRQKFYRIGLQSSDGTMLLSEVVSELCAQANLPPDLIDVTDLTTTPVRGFTVTNRYPCSSALQSLSKVFFFSPSNSNDKVKFTMMGSDSVATILESDMIDDGDREDPDNSRRGDTINVPRVLHWVYYDIAGGLAADMQSSERPEDGKNVGHQTVECSVIQSADEAATACAKVHAMMEVAQKGEIEFSLPDNFLRLTESDPIIVQVGAKMERAVIQKVDIDDGEQRYRCVRGRQSIHTMEVEGIPAAPVTPPPSSIKGPTRIDVLDIPLWRDVDDRLGFWVAISGIYSSWPGATVEMSIDGGANYPYSSGSNVPAVIGSLITELADQPAEYPDEVSSCQVAISTPSALLENTDLTGLLNGRNLALIGNEIVQFASADEVSEGVWELSYFLRGRKASGSSHHDIGERFVLLDDRVFFVPAELTWRNRTLTFRATTFDTPVEEATIEAVGFVGKNQIERAVANLAAHRDGTNAVATWIGVGRLGGGMNAAQGAYFAGFRVTLTDGTTTQILPDQLANSITASLTAFTGPVTVRVQQRNSITGLGPASEVII